MSRLVTTLAALLLLTTFSQAAGQSSTGKDTTAAELLEAGLAKGKSEHKPVFLIFGSPGCGWCKVLEKYHVDAEVKELLGKHLVLVKIDVVDNPGGQELYLKYGAQRGVPAFSILDVDGKAVADSGDGDKNVGFPAKPEEIASYFAALEKGGVKLTAGNIELLKSKLRAVYPKLVVDERLPPEPPPVENKPVAKVYDEETDGSKQIEEALTAAKKDNKRVLLQFGANWCGWCHKLHKLFKDNDEVRQKLDAGYVVVLVDVNGEHNKAVNKKYGNPTRNGLPVIVVLDAEGKQLTTQDTGKLEEGNHHDPQKVLAFLAEWELKK